MKVNESKVGYYAYKVYKVKFETGPGRMLLQYYQLRSPSIPGARPNVEA